MRPLHKTSVLVKRLSLLTSGGVYLLCCASLQGQNIEGYIQDIHKKPVPYVRINAQNHASSSMSNPQGYYYLALPAGEHKITFSSIGYLPHHEKITTKHDTLRLDVQLQRGLHKLPSVEIHATSHNSHDFVPGSAYYLSRKDLEAFSYTDPSQVLGVVPGIYVQEEDGFGLRPNIGIRGTGSLRSEKITIMEDGILMAPAPYAASAAYYFPSIGRMSGVEVIKGSSQIKYGPNTTGGVINLLSTPIPHHFLASIDTRGGTFTSHRTHAKVGASTQHVGFLVETQQYGSRGFKELADAANTGFHKQDYVAKLQLHSDPSKKDAYHTLLLKTGYVGERSNETYLGLTAPDFAKNPYMRYASSAKDIMNANQQQYSARYGLEKNNFRYTAIAYYNRFHRNWYKLDKVLEQDDTFKSISSILDNPTTYTTAYATITGAQNASKALYVQANNRTYQAYGLQQQASIQWQKGLLQHQIEGSLRYHGDEMDRFQGTDIYSIQDKQMQLAIANDLGTESNRVEQARTVSGYASYQLQIGKYLLCTPGFRYENIHLSRKDYGTKDIERTAVDLKHDRRNVQVFLPGIGVHYFINPRLKTFFGMHKGFSPPNTQATANAEESLNYEIGAHLTNKNTRWIMVGFYNDYKNLLGSILQATGGETNQTLYNGGKAQVVGVEVQGVWDIIHYNVNRLTVTSNYTFTSTRFLSSFASEFSGWGEVMQGDRLPYIPPHQASLLASFQRKKYVFNLQSRYTAPMRTRPGQDQNQNDLHTRTDALLNINGRITYHWNKHFTLYANVLNLTDQAAIVATRPAGLRPNAPRRFLLGVRATW